MNKVLIIHPEKCTGCRLCELVCSFQKEKEFNPCKSRIRIIKWEREGVDFPIVCQQCEDAPCMAACPTGALHRDEAQAIVINQDVCIGCRTCSVVCPFGAVFFDGQKMVKCDLCGGQPECVKYCQIKAVEYTSPYQASLAKARQAALKLQTGSGKVLPDKGAK